MSVIEVIASDLREGEDLRQWRLRTQAPYSVALTGVGFVVIDRAGRHVSDHYYARFRALAHAERLNGSVVA